MEQCQDGLHSMITFNKIKPMHRINIKLLTFYLLVFIMDTSVNRKDKKNNKH